jgi:hypothetical protein
MALDLSSASLINQLKYRVAASASFSPTFLRPAKSW